MWEEFDFRLWNKHLTYEQNIRNGVNLPSMNQMVVIFDYDTPRFFIGSFSKGLDGDLKLYSTETGRSYPIYYVKWQEFDY